MNLDSTGSTGGGDRGDPTGHSLSGAEQQPAAEGGPGPQPLRRHSTASPDRERKERADRLAQAAEKYALLVEIFLCARACSSQATLHTTPNTPIDVSFHICGPRREVDKCSFAKKLMSKTGC